MTSLSLQLALLQRRIEHGADREALRTNAQALVLQSQRLTQLVGELLDVTRIQAGKLELHRESVRMDTLVREVCARCAPLLDAGQNTLTLELEPEVVSEVDPSRMDQVLVNLLGNAARHARGAPIEVALWTTEGETCIRVRDRVRGSPKRSRRASSSPSPGRPA